MKRSSGGKARTRDCHFYSAAGVCVSLKSPAQLSASSSDMPTEAPSRLRLRRPERPEKLLTGPPRLDRTIKGGEKKAHGSWRLSAVGEQFGCFEMFLWCRL